MIRSITADNPSFKTVHFEPGFNVVLAERTKESTGRDARNGLGKSTLIEIIHFCLGAGTRKDEGLMVEPLHDWTFTVELELATGIVSASRNTARPNRINIAGPTNGWPIAPSINQKSGTKSYSPKDWSTVLGNLMFGLPIDEPARKYTPTFRSLISYFVRRGNDAYAIPFEHYRTQQGWDVQINNTFLLDLNWTRASDLQSLKDKKKHIDNLKRGLKAGVLAKYLGTIGELEAEEVRIRAEIEENQAGLASFNVLPQYRQLEKQAYQQTRQIQRLRNKRLKLGRRLSYYETKHDDEKETESSAIVEIYEKAGVNLHGGVRRRLDDVQQFHASIIENRKIFLASEIEKVKAEIEDTSRRLAQLTKARGETMSTLKAHGPWDEYQLLTEQQSQRKAQLQAFADRIQTLREIQEGASTHKIDKELLLKRLRQDHDERRDQRDNAVSLFNANAHALYAAPGSLVVDITDSGYKFTVDIQSSGSRRMDRMKVFCYDLVLAELWGAKERSAGLIVHDSIIYDGVDERQRALGIQLAARKAEALGFQYICALNSDMVPYNEFDEDFGFDGYVRLTLTDADTNGGLFGIRF